jgi:hypothetical protein
MEKAAPLNSMSEFQICDHLSWTGRDGVFREGITFKMNHKTASVKVEKGTGTLHPNFLQKARLKANEPHTLVNTNSESSRGALTLYLHT